METDFEIQQGPERKNWSADALSCLFAEQPDQPTFDDNILSYEANVVHDINDKEGDINVETHAIQSSTWAQRKDTYYHQSAKEAEAPSIQNFFTEFGILLMTCLISWCGANSRSNVVTSEIADPWVPLDNIQPLWSTTTVSQNEEVLLQASRSKCCLQLSRALQIVLTTSTNPDASTAYTAVSSRLTSAVRRDGRPLTSVKNGSRQ